MATMRVSPVRRFERRELSKEFLDPGIYGKTDVPEESM